MHRVWSHLKRTHFDSICHSKYTHNLIFIEMSIFFFSLSFGHIFINIFYCIVTRSPYLSGAFCYFHVLLKMVSLDLLCVPFENFMFVCRGHCGSTRFISIDCSHLDFYYLNLLRNEPHTTVSLWWPQFLMCTQ